MFFTRKWQWNSRPSWRFFVFLSLHLQLNPWSCILCTRCSKSFPSQFALSVLSCRNLLISCDSKSQLFSFSWAVSCGYFDHLFNWYRVSCCASSPVRIVILLSNQIVFESWLELTRIRYSSRNQMAKAALVFSCILSCKFIFVEGRLVLCILWLVLRSLLFNRSLQHQLNSGI